MDRAAGPLGSCRPTETPIAEHASARARILIVEDNALNRLLVHDLLELRGPRGSRGGHGRRSPARPRLGRLDLLLLDVQIPGGGAEAVIRHARARARFAEIPIVAVTSLAMPGDRERLLGSGFQGYLSKPIDTRTFGAIVESFLNDAHRAEDPQRVRRVG